MASCYFQAWQFLWGKGGLQQDQCSQARRRVPGLPTFFLFSPGIPASVVRQNIGHPPKFTFQVNNRYFASKSSSSHGHLGCPGSWVPPALVPKCWVRWKSPQKPPSLPHSFWLILPSIRLPKFTQKSGSHPPVTSVLPMGASLQSPSFWFRTSQFL